MIYQWQKDGVDLTDGSNINGSTTATLTITSARVSDSGSYIVQVVNAAGIATSDEAILTVNAHSGEYRHYHSANEDNLLYRRAWTLPVWWLPVLTATVPQYSCHYHGKYQRI